MLWVCSHPQQFLGELDKARSIFIGNKINGLESKSQYRVESPYDVAEFETAAKHMLANDTEMQDIQALEQVCDLYQRGPFLGTFHLKNVDADFDTWISRASHPKF